MRFLNITTPVCLLLAALSATVTACDGYLFCHCYNSDGKPNDVATQTVCNRFPKDQSKMIDVNKWSDGAKECQYAGPKFTPHDPRRPRGDVQAYGFGNCDWRGMWPPVPPAKIPVAGIHRLKAQRVTMELKSSVITRLETSELNVKCQAIAFAFYLE
uniref:Secreted protein n=1 Tax=Colletotrichum fructicola (strain Nara gc5) TaxID=1213859 RepID=L2G169_COLFN